MTVSCSQALLIYHDSHHPILLSCLWSQTQSGMRLSQSTPERERGGEGEREGGREVPT